jgi:hypothetical protein
MRSSGSLRSHSRRRASSSSRRRASSCWRATAAACSWASTHAWGGGQASRMACTRAPAGRVAAERGGRNGHVEVGDRLALPSPDAVWDGKRPRVRR